jgi:dinuclear metal center YbgI/SA1388 family protein
VEIAGVLAALERLAPAVFAEEWDNVGLIVGRRTHRVARVLVALDLRMAVLDEARDAGADTVVVHHPPIFPSLAAVTDASPTGELVMTSVERGIAVVAAHTNLDSARGGLNHHMAQLLGLREAVPLLPAPDDPTAGLGRVGACALERFADLVVHVGQVVPGPVVWTGDPDAEIARIACCTGSGASLIEAAQAHGADAYVTSDLKYHDAERAPGLGLIGVPHGQIEALMLARWCPELAAALAPQGVVVTVAAARTDPWQPAGPAPL